MAKYAYVAVFAKESDGYTVTFPDVPSAITSGSTLPDAIEMAEDALCLVLHDYEVNNKPLPKPSTLESVKVGVNEFVQYISCDTKFYHDYFAAKSVKKNLTIPANLNALAEKQGINFSQVLQEALKERLRVSQTQH